MVASMNLMARSARSALGWLPSAMLITVARARSRPRHPRGMREPAYGGHPPPPGRRGYRAASGRDRGVRSRHYPPPRWRRPRRGRGAVPPVPARTPTGGGQRRRRPAVGLALPFGRVHEHSLGLPSAEATVAADELLVGRDLLGARVDRAVDDQVADVRQRVVPLHVGHRVRAEGRERVGSLDAVLVEVAEPSLPRTTDPCSRLRTTTNPTPGCAARAPTRPGYSRSMSSSTNRPGRRVK